MSSAAPMEPAPDAAAATSSRTSDASSSSNNSQATRNSASSDVGPLPDSTPVTRDSSSSSEPTSQFTLSPHLASSVLSSTLTNVITTTNVTLIPSSATSTTTTTASNADATTTSTATFSSSASTTPVKYSMFPEIEDDDAEEDDDDDERRNSASAAAGFECHICLDIAKDAVVSLCGHLFCWPCLHQWLETRPTVQLCPVCKAGISKDKVVPLYGRGGNGEQKDPRTKPPPPRPQGQRSEPESQGGFGAGAFGGWPGMIFGDGGSHLSFGIGAFPFAFFASAFNLNDGRPPPPEVGTQQHAEERFLSRIFICVSVLFAIWLVLL